MRYTASVASDTRDRLIRTTSRLLRKQGYGATGLNQVMSEAGAPKGSMYFHFPGGKEELAAAAIDHFAARVLRRLEDGLATGETVGDAVVAFIDEYIQHLEQTDFAEGCAVATIALDAAASHASLAGATGRALRSWTDRFAQALETEGRDPADAHGLASLIIAAIEGALVMAKGERSTEPFAAVREVLRDLLARRATASAAGSAAAPAAQRT
jgi:TetR/AcrR family transcriptional repressor of lmrAB and yxaGH operons